MKTGADREDNVPLLSFTAPDKPLPFMKWRRVAFVLTSLMMLITLTSLSTINLNLGVDFTGGTVVELRSSEPIDVAALRAQLTETGFEAASIQGFDAGMGATVRMPPAEDEEGEQETVRLLQAALGADYTIAGASVLGPKISGEFLRNSIIAVALAILAIAVYIWFRFEMKFGLAAFITTLYDGLIIFGLFSLTRMTFDLTSIAAILAVVGYSINDTVVVFDRIRENLRKYKAATVPEIIDRSITETLPRTIMTGVTTLFASMALAIFGGPVLFSFGIAISFGIVAGTISSVFVAAPLLIYLPGRMPGEEGRAEKENLPVPAE